MKAGNIGAFDYYNLKNIVADTSLREHLGDTGGKGEDK